MVSGYIQTLTQRLLAYEKCPHKLAFTCAIGIYIGISPFVGFHTVMTFIFGWFFTLSVPALLAVSIAVNNPWTMWPVYSFDHIFGRWLFHLFNIDYTAFEPAWFEACALFIKEKTGIAGLSLSAFLFGGNILGICIAFIMYPLIKRFFIACVSKKAVIPQQS